jgi:CubicO group peptidase (beta-lactamase class C family)
MIMTLALVLTLVAPALAKENNSAPRRNVPPAASGPTDPAEMESFMDGLLKKEMDENHIPGAAVSVVKDGKLFFTKGYGYADLENKIPVDAEQTVFAIGSVGKLFTWTAVMQLAEQGKLDLDADVNTYLDFRIPDTYPGPITLRHLLTHAACLGGGTSPPMVFCSRPTICFGSGGCPRSFSWGRSRTKR